jgi:hypothetical protein
MLARINRAFAECMLEYQHAKSVFDRIFDASNEALSEDDVKTVWLQAAAIMEQGRIERCGTDLLDLMVSSMRAENAKALVEFDAAMASPRDHDAWDHINHATFQPHPACSRHRWIQGIGTIAVALRDSFSSEGRRLVWYADEAEATSSPLDFKPGDGKPLVPRLSLLSAAEYSPILVARGSFGFASVLSLSLGTDKLPIDGIDVSWLPPTLWNDPDDPGNWGLFLGSVNFARPPHPDFLAHIAKACPRLTSLYIVRCEGLRLRFSFRDHLPRQLVHGNLWCPLFSDNDLDFADVPSSLRDLSVADSGLDVCVNGQAPPTLYRFDVADTKVRIQQPQRPSFAFVGASNAAPASNSAGSSSSSCVMC